MKLESRHTAPTLPTTTRALIRLRLLPKGSVPVFTVRPSFNCSGLIFDGRLWRPQGSLNLLREVVKPLVHQPPRALEHFCDALIESIERRGEIDVSLHLFDVTLEHLRNVLTQRDAGLLR